MSPFQEFSESVLFKTLAEGHRCWWVLQWDAVNKIWIFQKKKVKLVAERQTKHNMYEWEIFMLNFYLFAKLYAGLDFAFALFHTDEDFTDETHFNGSFEIHTNIIICAFRVILKTIRLPFCPYYCMSFHLI